MQPEHPSWALGILGMPGFTAYMGLLDIGQPKAGETLVVAAATDLLVLRLDRLANLKVVAWLASQVGLKNAVMQ